MNELEYTLRQRRRMRPWVTKAVKLVGGKISDARAHAEKAVTETLRTTPDGRPSLAVIRRNPSFRAALVRLDELWEAIAGPAVTSTGGLVHDATESYYRDSRYYWHAEVPEEFRVPSPEPTRAQLDHVRGLLWFGLPIRADFAPQFKRLSNTLSAALGAAGSNSDASDRARVSSLRTWETQSRSVMIQRVGLAMNDANQRADLQAMRDTILPRHHD